MSLRPPSLRVKLTLWFLTLFAVLQLVLFATVIHLRKDSISRSFEDDLRHGAAQVVARIQEHGLPLSGEGLLEFLPADRGIEVAVLRDRRGRILAATQALRPDQLPLQVGPDTRTGLIGPRVDAAAAHAFDVDSDSPLRVATLPFQERGGNLLYLQAAAPASFVRSNVGGFAQLLFPGLPLGLLVAAVAAWLIAGRVVAPLQELAEAAKVVVPGEVGGGLRVQPKDGEVAVLQRELNGALGRLEDAYRAQRDFVNNVAHEFKTPIAILLAEAQLIGKQDGRTAELRGYVASVESEMQRLEHLVDSFLTLARADMGKHCVEWDVIPLNDLLLETVQHWTSFARHHEVRIVTNLVATGDDEPDPNVLGDPDLLRALFDNLLRNAIRFSPVGSRIDVCARMASGRLAVSVRDRGPGIPEQYIERVFDHFVQAPTGSGRSRGGSGLGLAIAKSVVELHGGSIGVRNHEEGGCELEVFLPIEDEERHADRETGGKAAREVERAALTI